MFSRVLFAFPTWRKDVSCIQSNQCWTLNKLKQHFFWVMCVLFTWFKRDDWWVGWQEWHWVAGMGGSSKACAWGGSLFAHLALCHSCAKECAHQPGPTLCTHVSWQKLPQAARRVKFPGVNFSRLALCLWRSSRRKPDSTSVQSAKKQEKGEIHPFTFMGLTHLHGAHPFTWGTDWPFKRFSFTLNTNCHTLLGAWVTGLYVGWLGWAHMLREAFCSFRRACGRQVFAPLFPRQGESGYYNTHTHTNSNTFTFLFQTHFFDTVIFL